MTDENGASASDPFASAVADLRAFLAETDREERRLKHELAVLQVKTKRARRALDSLTADEPKTKAKRVAGGAVSEQRQAEVLAALRDGARTVREVAERIGTNNETARKAVYYLRDRERVRMTGKVQVPGSTTPSTTYALMPGGDDGD